MGAMIWVVILGITASLSMTFGHYFGLAGALIAYVTSLTLLTMIAFFNSFLVDILKTIFITIPLLGTIMLMIIIMLVMERTLSLIIGKHSDIEYKSRYDRRFDK